MKNKRIVGLLLVILLLIMMVIIIFITPVFNKYKNTGNLIINEVMATNKNTILDKFGNYSDYIEIYNGYDYDINLLGYYLSDDDYETKKWTFPDVTIKANEYLIVYASGLNVYEDGEIHTNFKLDKNNEVVTLSTPNAKAISKIRYFDMISDSSYGYDGDNYVYYYVGTPKMKNDGATSLKPIKINQSMEELYINEYMVENNTALKSKLGYYSGVIELYNDCEHDINLSGYYLSDDLNNITKYKFPDVTIGSKEYLLVYTSGKNTYEKGELHTNFELNKSDKFLIISDKLKNEVDKVSIKESNIDISYGYYKGEWQQYSSHTLGKENDLNYINNLNISKDVSINEVSVINTEAIELKNLTDKDINLKNYSISDKSGFKSNLPNIVLKANSYIVLYGSDTKSYTNGKVYLGFHINNSKETLYLYKNNILIDTFDVGRIINGVSSGISNNNKVYFKEITLGKANSKNYYTGYTREPNFSINGGYVEKGTTITLESERDAKIYYTLDGSFPSNRSTLYKGPITINKTTVIKAIAYKDGNIESEIISRTFLVGRTHDLAVVSISTNESNLFGSNGILTNYKQETARKISFEFYESDGTLGVSFIGDTKLSGVDSREQPQKSMAIYLRKEYGLQDVTYPFFEDNDTLTYSSILLRNAGEDPKRIRIMDAVLTRTLKGQMDIDIQDYRPVVVYINGKYYGMYNLREKLNGDYVESKYGLDKDNIDLIKYFTATTGTTKEYSNLYDYIMSHDPKNKAVYEYLKTQIDMQALCNYWIAQSYYGNTDLGNVRFWKEKNSGKWRFMIYDLDWSMWNANLNVGYPVRNVSMPAATYQYTVINLTRRLYRNSEFKDLYLKTWAEHLKTTFKPERMNKIVDELKKEIEQEMPYHINRWGYPNSMNAWNNNIKNFKTMINSRYNAVLNRLKGDLGLTNAEYEHYFGEVR